mgnify:CR=1 FL=1
MHSQDSDTLAHTARPAPCRLHLPIRTHPFTHPLVSPSCPPTHLQEPRRVGGPLPLQQGNHPIHLRVIVDHSCVEVYTGTGEVGSCLCL